MLPNKLAMALRRPFTGFSSSELYSHQFSCCIKYINSRIRCNYVKFYATMSTWMENKEKILNMDKESKRREYIVKKYETLGSIPTWKTQNETFRNLNKPNEEDKEQILIQMDNSLNKLIAPKISVWKGDITQLEIDAIVNAANGRLLGGGGVDGAIHRAAGPELKKECATLNGCKTGFAKITGGYLLPAKYVIHTVGPQNKSHPDLHSCYKSCFKLQRDHQIKSIAFPCISTGVYHFPNNPAAHIACSNVREFLEDDIKNHNGSVDRIIFCVFMQEDVDIYERLAQLYFPVD